MAKFANKFGFGDRFFRNIEMEDDETPMVEEVSRANSTRVCGPLAIPVKARSG